MPSSSDKQRRFMEAVAHDPRFAKKAGVPQSVGKEYARADEAKRSQAVSRDLTKRLEKRDKK